MLTQLQRDWLINTWAETIYPEDEVGYAVDAVSEYASAAIIELADQELDSSWREEFTDTFGVTLA